MLRSALLPVTRARVPLPKLLVRKSSCAKHEMLTFFSTPKPFVGHISVIQRNALLSWKRVHPDAEIILFGDEPGAAEICAELNIRHVPEVKRNEHGTKYLGPIFDRAAALARYDLLCYINCDIVLLDDFLPALTSMVQMQRNFLMVGRRWDLDLRDPLLFESGWQTRLRERALSHGLQRPPQWIDYFAFSRTLYRDKLPPFVIGRPGWDNWLIWFARQSGFVVADATRVVVAVHQNHDYSYHPEGEAGVWYGAEARQNYAFLEGGRCFATMQNATHRLTGRGIRQNYLHYGVVAQRRLRWVFNRFWFFSLGLTRPLRHALGLRKPGN